ncbi:hypothetical protein OKW35_004040 [Paraburkholderia sp. MM5477-R1]
MRDHASELAEQQRMHGRGAPLRDRVKPGAEIGQPGMPLGGAPLAFGGDIGRSAHDLIDNTDRRA